MSETIVKKEGMTRRGFGRLFRTSGYIIGAEIGVRTGEYSELLCRRIPNLHLFCVDPYTPYDESAKSLDPNWHEANYRIAKNRLLPYKTTFIRKTSAEAALDIEFESLDFVYIDANHLYDYAMEDIIIWSRRVRSGGIVSGHDYVDNENCGVRSAVNDYLRAMKIIEAYFTDESWPSFYWIKP